MTTFSPITGYGLTPETIGAAPTLNSPLVGSAAMGTDPNAPLPPDPMGGGGAIPNAGVPTGYDTAGAYFVDGAGNYIQPPVTDMGGAGPASTGAIATTSGGGPVGQSGWNADYGTAFARAFQMAGVSPEVASAALHTLAANAPTTAELEEALQYLSTQEGIELAPYLAENLAKQGPGYASIGPAGGTDVGMPTDPTAYPVDPTTPIPGTEPGSTGGLEIVAQNEDGTYVLSDGRTIVGQTEDGNLVIDDGSVVDQEGNEIAPAGTVPLDGTGAAPDGEVDPTTGKPVDPNAAEAGATPPPAEGGGVNVPAVLLGTGAAVVGGTVLYKKVIRPRLEAREAAKAPDAGRAPAATPSLADDAAKANLDRMQRSAARLEQSLARTDLTPQQRATQLKMLDQINGKLNEVGPVHGPVRPPAVDPAHAASTPAAQARPATLTDQMRRIALTGEAAEARHPVAQRRDGIANATEARSTQIRSLEQQVVGKENELSAARAARQVETNPHTKGNLTKTITRLEQEIPSITKTLTAAREQHTMLDGMRQAVDREIVPLDHRMALLENQRLASLPKPTTPVAAEGAENLLKLGARSTGDDAARGAVRMLPNFLRTVL